MNAKLLGRERIAAAIEKAPAVEAIVKKLASKVVRGVRLPETFSAKGLDYDAQRELEHLFGTIGQRTSDGRFYLPIFEFLREPAAWRDAVEFFGLAKDASESGRGDVFQRLKLLVPEAAEALDILSRREDVARFVADKDNGNDWMRLFRYIVGNRLLRDDCSPITLSQLGSDCLGDSKKLRTGALRRQLAIILGLFGGMDAADERTVFARFGVVDNPYTSFVTVFAPFVFRCAGEWFDFPRRLFRRGLACQLPLETIRYISGVTWDEGADRTVTTSENAAPFARMVQYGIPCVYTEGYPNHCVKTLLALFRVCGVTCVHEGDADLDGFNIAHEVSMFIPVKRVVAAEALSAAMDRNPSVGIPLTDEQRQRAKSFLDCNPHCAYAGDIRRMLQFGRWIEQESFEELLNNDQEGAPL